MSMSIDAINQIRAQIPDAAGETTKTQGALDKDDFLELLVTQMQYQDPLDPQDPAEYMSQMTEFSNLEQLINVNDGLDSMIGQQSLQAQLVAAGLVGREAQVAGSHIDLAGGTADTVQFYIPRDSERTHVNVYNEVGNLVEVVDLGGRNSGTHDFTWDGVLGDGSVATDGRYTFDVTAVDAAGQGITTQTQFTGRISSVAFDRGEAYLEIDGQMWSLGTILGISE